MSPPAKDRLGEFGRIERFFRPLAAQFPGALGLTDDAALIAVPPGQELVVTTDAVVSGIHFLPTDSPGDIARKALRVNLSDLAAKGARPMAYLLTLALGRDVDDAWVDAFAQALSHDQARFGIALAGGDSVSTDGPIWVSVTAFGLVEAGRMVRRGGARPGDIVLVTGTIGDAALGLAVATGRLAPPEEDVHHLLARYATPEPRCALAAAIANYAHAALDVSDGLAGDFTHLCQASRVDGVIEIDRIPLSEPARRVLARDPTRLASILGGGDDYEILFTAPPEAEVAIDAAAKAAGIPVTRIGHMMRGDGRTIFVDASGSTIEIAVPGWTHS
jgi:thiamine-monophosphate kinase